MNKFKRIMKDFLSIFAVFIGLAILVVGFIWSFLPTDAKVVDTMESETATVKAEEFPPMLTKVYKDDSFPCTLYILADDEGVMYLVHDLSADSGASCMMVNADGSPRIWMGDKEDEEPIEIIEDQHDYNLYRDKSTNVLYLYAKSQMTVMRNADGSIKLYQP